MLAKVNILHVIFDYLFIFNCVELVNENVGSGLGSWIAILIPSVGRIGLWSVGESQILLHLLHLLLVYARMLGI